MEWIALIFKYIQFTCVGFCCLHSTVRFRANTSKYSMWSFKLSSMKCTITHTSQPKIIFMPCMHRRIHCYVNKAIISFNINYLFCSVCWFLHTRGITRIWWTPVLICWFTMPSYRKCNAHIKTANYQWNKLMHTCAYTYESCNVMMRVILSIPQSSATLLAL